jgi:hypothetical protein
VAGRFQFSLGKVPVNSLPGVKANILLATMRSLYSLDEREIP